MPPGKVGLERRVGTRPQWVLAAVEWGCPGRVKAGTGLICLCLRITCCCQGRGEGRGGASRLLCSHPGEDAGGWGHQVLAGQMEGCGRFLTVLWIESVDGGSEGEGETGCASQGPGVTTGGC